jgi:hypothetical protein
LTEEATEAAFAADSVVPEQMPRSFKEAMGRPDAEQWKAACDKEYECIIKNDTYDLIGRESLPAHANILGNTWVCKIKPGMLYRARLCVRGDWQIEGVDYFEVFAPTAKLASFRMILHLGATFDLEVHQVDFETAFMNGDIEEDIYMRQIPGYEDPEKPHHVCKLKKALNGIRQAPRQWFAKLKEALLELGFEQSKEDPTVLYRKGEGGFFYVLIFVDDLILATNNKKELEAFKGELGRRFVIKDLGEISTYLGIDITRARDGHTMALNQGKYIDKLLNRFHLSDCKPKTTPMEVGHDLTNPANPVGKDVDVPYPQLLGALMYLMVCTRPDLAYAISVLSRFMAKGRHNNTHWKAATRVLAYLKQTRDWSLILGGRGELKLLGYCDASWADDQASRKSTLGFCYTLGEKGLISWKSKLSTTQALSTAEAEYYAAGFAVTEGLWLVRMLGELGVQASPFTLKCDSNSAIHLIKNPVVSYRSKHIEIKHHFIRDHVENKEIVVDYVETAKNWADVFTKALPFTKLLPQCQQFFKVPKKVTFADQ